MAKVIPRKKKSDDRETITVKTKAVAKPGAQDPWWSAGSKSETAQRVIATAAFLKEQQQYRYRQAGIFSRLYGNIPLFNVGGMKMTGMGQTNSLPIDRPTMNVIQSCVDTLASRITQNRPRPVFLTDEGDYKSQTLAKQLNHFIMGEFQQTKAYQRGELMFRDAGIIGTGAIKIYETSEKRVGLDRILEPELLVDPNDAIYGEPRQLFQVKLVDRSVLANTIPEYRSSIAKAENAFPEANDSTETISDQVMIVEAWHLPSGKDAGDGRHVLACSEGLIFDEEFMKDKFPFVFLPYSPRMTGFWGQGLVEQLMGTQIEINKLLMTISKSINLVGVPRVFVEDGSKVVKAHLNNDIGAIVTYRGTKPVYEVAPCVPQEIYAQLQRLVQYAYQQSGISSLAAMSQKPAGLNSGQALREYDDIQSDRFASLNRRYNNLFIDLAYQVIDKARDIAERDGKYQTVYPNKDGTQEIDLPAAKLLDDPFIIQCFDSSSLPRDPAGRKETITEYMQAGILSPQEGRRLLDFPDLQAEEKLANAPEERIKKVLSDIVENGKYTPPDPFMDIPLAKQKTFETYNLYTASGLEESKQQLLRDFWTQLLALEQAAMPPPMPGGPGAPQALPEAQPTNAMIPNVPAA